jgi:ligand-binding sensor domain-containing protein
MLSFDLLFNIKKLKAEMRTRKHFGSTRQLLAVIILTHLFWCHTWGLNPDANVNHLLVDQWKMADGIPSDTILSITQTPDGYLWIATARGLVRYDGIKFSAIPLTGSEKDDPRKTIIPDTLMVDRAGTLWIGTTGGLTSYHSKTRQFSTFTSADGLTSDRFRRIKEDMNGNLWISFFASHVNRFANGKFTAFNANHGLEGNKINAIVEDRKGQLLFGDREKGVFKYKNGKFFKYPVPGLEKHQIITMHEDQEGNLWIGSNKGLFKVYDDSVQRYTTKHGLSHDYIIDIKEDREHVLWIAAQNGLNRLKKQQNGTLLIESLLTTFSLTCLYKDMEDNIWAGTYNSGILRIKDGKFISYAPLEALRETFLLSLFQDRKGDTWIGGLNGQLFRCRGSNYTECPVPPELSGTGIAAISRDNQENLWLGTNGKGVFQKKKEIFIQYTTRDGLSDNLVTSIYKDSRGSMWFGTYDGVSVHRYPGCRIESFNSRDGLAGKKVHNIYEDKNGDTWIAADNGITVLKQGKLKKENASFYLQGVPVTCIYEDPAPPEQGDRIYWIATHGEGLKRLRLKDRTVTSYTTVEGMTTNIIFQFFEDRQENFWLMSDNGILCVSKSELNRFASGTGDKINCISFGISDGLKSLEFNNEFPGTQPLKPALVSCGLLPKRGYLS